MSTSPSFTTPIRLGAEGALPLHALTRDLRSPAGTTPAPTINSELLRRKYDSLPCPDDIKKLSIGSGLGFTFTPVTPRSWVSTMPAPVAFTPAVFAGGVEIEPNALNHSSLSLGDLSISSDLMGALGGDATDAHDQYTQDQPQTETSSPATMLAVTTTLLNTLTEEAEKAIRTKVLAIIDDDMALFKAQSNQLLQKLAEVLQDTETENKLLRLQRDHLAAQLKATETKRGTPSSPLTSDSSGTSTSLGAGLLALDSRGEGAPVRTPVSLIPSFGLGSPGRSSLIGTPGAQLDTCFSLSETRVSAGVATAAGAADPDEPSANSVGATAPAVSNMPSAATLQTDDVPLKDTPATSAVVCLDISADDSDAPSTTSITPATSETGPSTLTAATATVMDISSPSPANIDAVASERTRTPSTITAATTSTPASPTVLDLVSPIATTATTTAAPAVSLTTPTTASATARKTAARRTSPTAAAGAPPTPFGKKVASPSAPSPMRATASRTPSSTSSATAANKRPPMRFAGARGAISSPPRPLPEGDARRRISSDTAAAVMKPLGSSPVHTVSATAARRGSSAATVTDGTAFRSPVLNKVAAAAAAPTAKVSSAPAPGPGLAPASTPIPDLRRSPLGSIDANGAGSAPAADLAASPLSVAARLNKSAAASARSRAQGGRPAAGSTQPALGRGTDKENTGNGTATGSSARPQGRGGKSLGTLQKALDAGAAAAAAAAATKPAKAAASRSAAARSARDARASRRDVVKHNKVVSKESASSRPAASSRRATVAAIDAQRRSARIAGNTTASSGATTRNSETGGRRRWR